MDYTLNWSDDTLKTPFTLAGGTANTSSSSLKLTGKGYNNWGEVLEENLLHLLENFASQGTAPANPTVGQIWFNATTNTLSVYYSSVWNPVDTTGGGGGGGGGGGTSSGPTPPVSPTTGQLWYDTTEHKLKVFTDSSVWVEVFLQGGSATPLNRIPIWVTNPAGFTIPAFVPGSLILETSLAAYNPGSNWTVFNIIMKDDGAGNLISAGQMFTPNPDGITVDYISPGQHGGTVNPATGLVSMTTSNFTYSLQQWNGYSWVNGSGTAKFVQGGYAYTLLPA